jgi:cell division protein ZapA (FtsZ GTPase activity inhibitor)
MNKIDFKIKCAVQLLIQNLDGSLSQITYERPNLLSLREIIVDGMNVFDDLKPNNDNWHFIRSFNVARTPEEYDDLLTDEDLIK